MLQLLTSICIIFLQSVSHLTLGPPWPSVAYSAFLLFSYFLYFDKPQNFFTPCCIVFFLFILFFDIFDLPCLLSYLFEQVYAGTDVRMLNKSSCLPTSPGNCKKFPFCSKDLLKPRSPFYNLCSGLENVCKVTITSSHNNPTGNFIIILLKWNHFERFLDMFDFTSCRYHHVFFFFWYSAILWHKIMWPDT